MKTEIWMPVEGYEGLYEVSDLGRVRSLGNDKSRKTKILRQSMRGCYLKVALHKDGKQKEFSVHRLVAIAFVPNMFGDEQVNHINENKTDNRAENLMWCDSKENCNWKTRNKRIGKKLSKTVLQFTKSGEFIQEWSSLHEVQRVLGFSIGNISECCSGKIKFYKGFVWRYKTA